MLQVVAEEYLQLVAVFETEAVPERLLLKAAVEPLFSVQVFSLLF